IRITSSNNNLVLGNLASGNNDDGVQVSGTSSANRILGNLVGTDVTGTKRLGTNDDGILTTESGTDNDAAGPRAGQGHAIAASGADGVDLEAPGNRTRGNKIGTDMTGTQDLGNDGSGVEDSDSLNQIGGDLPGEGNVIAFNGEDGVKITDDTTVGTAV